MPSIHRVRSLALASTVAASLVLGSTASAAPLTFVKLDGLAGGTPAATAVYRADLSAFIGTIASITIEDGNALGGSPGQFSGFDLDAIVLSSTFITSATNVGTLGVAAAFNFGTSVLVPGVQQAPTDPALFGTSGGQVDNAVATLGTFDGNSTTNLDPLAPPVAFGFVSLGFGGKLSINLISALERTEESGPLYLYIGEVGDNGEVAAGSITISSQPVPEPTSLALFGLGLVGLGALRRFGIRR